jgi:CheY-like chemotaxis protein
LVVLFAEDNPINLRTGVRILQKFNCKVIQAVDGGKAWELSQQHYGEIDLFLLDINMPVLCGDDVCRKLRAFEEEKGLARKAVFALTGKPARGGREWERGGWGMGMEEHL